MYIRWRVGISQDKEFDVRTLLNIEGVLDYNVDVEGFATCLITDTSTFY